MLICDCKVFDITAAPGADVRYLSGPASNAGGSGQLRFSHGIVIAN